MTVSAHLASIGLSPASPAAPLSPAGRFLDLVLHCCKSSGSGHLFPTSLQGLGLLNASGAGLEFRAQEVIRV